MEPAVECDVDCNAVSNGLSRSFGSSTLGFSGGSFIGGFNGKFIFDVRCNQWRSIGPRDCPVAYDMNSFRNFCNDYRLTTHLEPYDVRPVYVLDLLGGGFETCQYTPVCVACPGLGLCDISFNSHGGSQVGSSHSSPFRGPNFGQNQVGGNLWSHFLSRTGRSVESNEEEDESLDGYDYESDCDPDDRECLLILKERADIDYLDDEYDDSNDRLAKADDRCPCRRCRCCRRRRRWFCCHCNQG